MKRRNLSTVWGGLSLIALGIAFLVAQSIGWDRIWPLFPMLGGVAFFVAYAVSEEKDPGMIFLGTGALLVGLFFFGFTLGVWEWGEMSVLWPVFPLIGGVAFLAFFFAQGWSRDPGLLGLSLAALAVGVVGLLITHELLGRDIVKYWPLLLVLVGATGLLTGLLRAARGA
jgi:hypothetical protein